MSIRHKTHFLRIGTFVIIGLVLFITAILVFSTFHVFQRQIQIETYFNESVQGLSVGSPVKYRGIDIGRVKKVDFLGNIYRLSSSDSKYDHYIYVLMTINPKFLGHVSSDKIDAIFAEDVKKGLRVKLALLDLTGNAYLELNFMPPAQNPVLPIDWTPTTAYIPSTTSVLTRFTDSIQNILEGLQGVNFKKFFNNIQDLANTTNKAMTRVDALLSKSQADIVKSMKNVKSISGNMRDVTQQLKENPSGILFDKPQRVDPSKL